MLPHLQYRVIATDVPNGGTINCKLQSPVYYSNPSLAKPLDLNGGFSDGKEIDFDRTLAPELAATSSRTV
jgi:hypothetical protein